jgi:membrane dipeptidase
MRLIGKNPIDLGIRQEKGHIDLPRMMEGGLDAQIFACWVSPEIREELWVERTLAMIGAVKEQARAHADRMEIVLDGGDIRRIVSEGKVAAVIGIEGGHVIRDDIDTLRNYYNNGVRCMTLTWMNTNNWADSSDDTTMWDGLNELGREVVREMDRLGMIIDCSHVSDSTLFDVFETTKNPVLISHSCMRALCDIPRNVSDDELRALEENGGVICVNYFPGFLDKEFYERVSVLWDEFREKRRAYRDLPEEEREEAVRELAESYRGRLAGIPVPPVSRLVDHIDHAVAVAGIDHVGLGSDFDGISIAPEGLEDVSKLPGITKELAARGYSDEDIEKILGGNLLRLAEKVIR